MKVRNLKEIRMETGNIVVAEAIDASGWEKWTIYSVSLVFLGLWIVATVVSEFSCWSHIVRFRNNFTVMFKRNCPCLILDLDLL